MKLIRVEETKRTIKKLDDDSKLCIDFELHDLEEYFEIEKSIYMRKTKQTTKEWFLCGVSHYPQPIRRIWVNGEYIMKIKLDIESLYQQFKRKQKLKRIAKCNK